MEERVFFSFAVSLRLVWSTTIRIPFYKAGLETSLNGGEIFKKLEVLVPPFTCDTIPSLRKTSRL